MQCVVEVTSPLRILKRDTFALARQQMRLIGFIFEHEMDMPANQARAYGLGKYGQEVLLGMSFNA